MKFALLDGKKIEAQPNLIGDCRICGKSVRSYCGEQIVHHWKHIKLSDCDDWYERETEWHREWKNNFDISYQEIIKFDPKTSEKHIADIYNEKKDLVLEFQHSPIDTKEIEARELFYKRMIWMIDLTSVKKHLTFLKATSEIEDVLHKMKYNLPKDFKISDDFKKYESQERIGELFGFLGLENIDVKQSQYISQLQEKYMALCKKKNYFLMNWKHLHRRWDFSEKPKFIDIGENYIYQLIQRVEIGNAYVVKRYSKQFFINHYR